MINKITKILFIFLICLTCFNLVNYLMLMNTDFYQYLIFKISNRQETTILNMFKLNWLISYYANYVILITAFLILILKIIGLKKE